MNVSHTPSPIATAAATAGPVARSATGGAFTGFEDKLATAGAAVEAQATRQKRDEEVRLAAEQLVSTTFIMPLFSQLRNDPLAANLFHGGRGESVFQQQLDQELSDRIASGAGFDLVDAVAAQFGVGDPAARPARPPAFDPATRPVKATPGVDLHG